MEIRRAPLSKSPLRRQIIQNIQREFNLAVFYAVIPGEKFAANKQLAICAFRHFAQHVKGKRVVPIVNPIGSVFSSLMVAGPNQLPIGTLHIFIRNQRKGLFPHRAVARFIRGLDPYGILAVY